MTHDPNHPSPTHDAELDATVRRALEPSPAAVDRVVEHALHGPTRAPAPGHPGRRWALAGLALVAAVVLVTLLAIPRQHEPFPGAEATVLASIQNPAEPTSLSISNASGAITVTTAAGTRWILLPGDT